MHFKLAHLRVAVRHPFHLLLEPIEISDFVLFNFNAAPLLAKIMMISMQPLSPSTRRPDDRKSAATAPLINVFCRHKRGNEGHEDDHQNSPHTPKRRILNFFRQPYGSASAVVGHSVTGSGGGI